MKLRKMLAGLLAGAVAVSSMAISASAAISDTETVIDDSWSKNVTVDAGTAFAEGNLEVVLKDVLADAQFTLKSQEAGWPAVDLTGAIVDQAGTALDFSTEWGVATLPEGTEKIVVALTAENAEKLNTNGAVFAGKNFTFVSADMAAPAEEEAEAEDAEEDAASEAIVINNDYLDATPYSYVKDAVAESDITSITAVIDLPAGEKKGEVIDWNSWCTSGVIVTINGEPNYFVFAGTQVGWDVTFFADTDKAYIVPVADFAAVADEGPFDLVLPVAIAAGDTYSVDFVCQAWTDNESKEPVYFVNDVTFDGAEEEAEEEVAEEAEEEVAEDDAAPAEEVSYELNDAGCLRIDTSAQEYGDWGAQGFIDYKALELFPDGVSIYANTEFLTDEAYTYWLLGPANAQGWEKIMIDGYAQFEDDTDNGYNGSFQQTDGFINFVQTDGSFVKIDLTADQVAAILDTVAENEDGSLYGGFLFQTFGVKIASVLLAPISDGEKPAAAELTDGVVSFDTSDQAYSDWGMQGAVPGYNFDAFDGAEKVYVTADFEVSKDEAYTYWLIAPMDQNGWAKFMIDGFPAFEDDEGYTNAFQQTDGFMVLANNEANQVTFALTADQIASMKAFVNDDGTIGGGLAFQTYGVTVKSVTLSAEAPVAEEEAAAAEEAPADDKATNDKTSSDTGVEGVAVVAGLAVLAAGALIVAKKRK